MPTPKTSLPTPKNGSGQTLDRRKLNKRGGWIEFREKNGRRYARRRQWVKIDGQWKKVFKGRETSIPVMTEGEYKDYVNKRETAKRIRASLSR